MTCGKKRTALLRSKGKQIFEGKQEKADEINAFIKERPFISFTGLGKGAESINNDDSDIESLIEEER